MALNVLWTMISRSALTAANAGIAAHIHLLFTAGPGRAHCRGSLPIRIANPRHAHLNVFRMHLHDCDFNQRDKDERWEVRCTLIKGNSGVIRGPGRSSTHALRYRFGPTEARTPPFHIEEKHPTRLRVSL